MVHLASIAIDSPRTRNATGLHRLSLAMCVLGLAACATSEADQRQLAVDLALRTIATNQEPPVATESGLHECMEAIAEAPSVPHLASLMPRLIAAINKTQTVAKPDVYAALAQLRDVPGAVEALEQSYGAFSAGMQQERLRCIQIVGELQRVDALPFLRSVAWRDLPPPGPSIYNASQREVIEYEAASATRGIAFLKAADGTPSPQGSTEVLNIAVAHPSHHVQVAAIDAYLWNHGDSVQAQQQLQQLLPHHLHPLIGRPRFYKGASKATFEAQLAEWRKKWNRNT